MPTILPIHLDGLGKPANPDSERAIEHAVSVLADGGLVGIPTETVYGLAAVADDATAVSRIFQAKGRPANNPLIVHVLDITSARRLAKEWPLQAERLAERYWPGPLTLVVSRNPSVPDIVTAGAATVALRSPAHPVARLILSSIGRPIAAPSANASMEISPTCASDVAESLGERVDLILDGGPCERGIESTVVDVTHVPPVILRPGPISRTSLEEACGGPVLAVDHVADFQEPAASPGLSRRHYSPKTPLTVTANGAAAVAERMAAGGRVGWLAIRGLDDPSWPENDPALAGNAGSHLLIERLPLDPGHCAAGLYAALRRLDRAGLDEIVVDDVPKGEDWTAIRDRLARASAR